MRNAGHCVLVVFVVLAGLMPLTASADETGSTPFDVQAASAIVIDGDSGEILYAKNSDAQLPPASLTKIFTAWVAIQAS